MPVFPLFHANNTFQWLKRAVKGGRKSEEALPEKPSTLILAALYFSSGQLNGALTSLGIEVFGLI